MTKHGVIGIELVDIEKVMAFVSELERVDQQRAIKAGLAKGAAVFRRVGRRRLLSSEKGGVESGKLRYSMTSRVKRRKLGALSGFSMPEGSASWLHDKGTVRRYTKKGAHRGIMPASYFWKDTKEQSSGEAVNAVWEGVRTSMLRIKQRHG